MHLKKKLDEKKIIQLETSKNIVMPKNGEEINFDLKLGLDQFTPHIPHQKGIDAILTWIVENKETLANNQKSQSINSK
jgi:hypothetical protein